MGLFTKATKSAAKLRMAISGPSGSGKTYTSLQFATELARLGNGKIALVDTESGSASKYADIFDFDVAELTTFHPNNYVKMIREAESAGYDVVILDSITHAWTGKGGILDIVGGNFSKWKEVNPIEQNFIRTIIESKCHIIATMRAKTQYEVEKDDRGKPTPRKVGMGAIQRDGIEYEFDIVCMMDLENTLLVEKTRCSAIRGERVSNPDARFLQPIIKWLGAGGEDKELKAFGASGSAEDLRGDDEPEPVAQPVQPANGNGHKPQSKSSNANAKTQPDSNGHKQAEEEKPLPFEPTHEAAVDWGMGEGVFKVRQHAQNAYKKLAKDAGWKAGDGSKITTPQLFRLWIAEVNKRVAEKSNQKHEPGPLHTEFMQLGQEIYGEQWESVCRHNVERISEGKAQSVEELDETAIKNLISGLKKLKRQRQAA